jgi:hypothetical protein
MLMAALEAGGMRVHRSARRELCNVVPGERTYVPNRGGLFEPSRQEMQEPGWPRHHDGCALKLVTPFLGRLGVHEYRVVFMTRDFEEIRQSYRAAFGASVTCERIQQECEESILTLRNRRDVRDIRSLEYADVLGNPASAIASLGWPVDTARAARVVDTDQYRFRRERLVAGL